MAAKRFDPSYDVIVVGAGLGGLTAATRCAKAGKKVLLLELHNMTGGYATSFVRGRYEFEVSLHEACECGDGQNGMGYGTVRRMLEDLSIDTKARLRTLSKGNKEKVQLVLVMSRRARLYLLDEPIGGVDPAARDYILSTIIGSYNPDAAVIITPHLIHDIEPILDEFAFMGYGGRILLDGIADEVRAEKGKSLDELFREVFRC